MGVRGGDNLLRVAEGEIMRNKRVRYAASTSDEYGIFGGVCKEGPGHHIKKKGRREVDLGGRVLAAAYLPPHMNQHELVRALEQMTEAGTIMGDLNCCGGTKQRRLEELIEAKESGIAEVQESWDPKEAELEVVGYTDGSRMEGAAAGATAEEGIF